MCAAHTVVQYLCVRYLLILCHENLLKSQIIKIGKKNCIIRKVTFNPHFPCAFLVKISNEEIKEACRILSTLNVNNDSRTQSNIN